MPQHVREYNPISPSMGVYLATVMNSADVNRSGRLEVSIPALQTYKDAPDRSVADVTYTVRYCSPFAGQTPVRDARGTNSGDFHATQKSYGFWAVPPDVGTQVLVMFANGNVNEGFWIGCVPDMQINHMVPGLASSERSIEEGGGGPGGGDAQKRFGGLGIEDLPVAEPNRKVTDDAVGINTDYASDNSAKYRPVHTPMAETLLSQGLIKDKIRGITTSSARRETPSQVFGISTPGPIDFEGQFAAPNTDAVNRHGKVGEKFAHSRLGGHSFVMDDGTPSEEGKTPIESEMIRFRTRKGAQVLLHDSENMVYIINSTGTAWIELSEDGKIDLFADESFSVHTIGDFNLRAERDINIEAARNINMKATGQNTIDQFINSNEDIVTGRIHIDAKEDIEMIAELDIKAKAGVDIEMFAVKDIAVHSGEDFNLETGLDIHMRANDDFELFVTDNASLEIGSDDSTGPGGSARGDLQIRVKNDHKLFTGADYKRYITGNHLLEAAGDDKIYAANHWANVTGEIHFNTSGKVDAGVVGSSLLPVGIVGVQGERVPADVVVQLDTFENVIVPQSIDKEVDEIKRQSIMKRVPTAEPYAEHENKRKVVLNNIVSVDKSGILFTDRELKDERFTETPDNEDAQARRGV